MKIKVFGWRVLLDRLTSKDQLLSRSILSSSHDLPCALCFQWDENLPHLCLSCSVAKKVWSAIFK